MATLVWDSPAEVKWSGHVTADQNAAHGDASRSRAFPTLKDAVRFVMEELEPSPKMIVGVYPERGTALIDIAEIEQAYRSGPRATTEPGGVA